MIPSNAPSGLLTSAEADELQGLILDHHAPGAESFPMAGGYEVHPREGDFSQAIRTWLGTHGFKRAIDPQRGPFYYR